MRQDVVILITLRSIKGAELTINVAYVGVVDVAINDVGHDLVTASAVIFFLREIAPRVSQRTEISEWPAIKFERFFG